MNSIKSSTLKKGVEVGRRTGQKVAIRVSNICTHFSNRLSTSKCDTLRLLQKAEFDIDRLVQQRTSLGDPERETLENVRRATVAVYSCKAVLEKKVAEYAQSLTSSLKGLESRMLDFDHVATELRTITDFFNKTYFEARYGDYLFSGQQVIKSGKIPFQPCATSDFTDPEKLVKAGEFELLSRRLVEDLVGLELDFDRLATGVRDDTECYTTVEKAILTYKARYFRSLNRTSGDYQLSEYGAELYKKKEEMDREMASEGMDEGTDQGLGTSVRPLEEFDILDDEIYMSDGTSRTQGEGDQVTPPTDVAPNDTSEEDI